MMEEAHTFSCRIDNIKSVTDVLNCLSVELNKDQPCHIEATADCESNNQQQLSFILISLSLTVHETALLFVVAGRAKTTLVSNSQYVARLAQLLFLK